MMTAHKYRIVTSCRLSTATYELQKYYGWWFFGFWDRLHVEWVDPESPSEAYTRCKNVQKQLEMTDLDKSPRPEALKEKMKEFIVVENERRNSSDVYKDSFSECFDFAEQCINDGLITSPEELLTALTDLVKGDEAGYMVFAFGLGFAIKPLEKIYGRA